MEWYGVVLALDEQGVRWYCCCMLEFEGVIVWCPIHIRTLMYVMSKSTIMMVTTHHCVLILILVEYMERTFGEQKVS